MLWKTLERRGRDMRIARPDSDAVRGWCGQAQEVLVASPFYGADSLNWVTPRADGTLEFWTRLNPYDWAAGVANPPALLSFAEQLGHERFTLRVHRALHAKFYVADARWAAMGSANLSNKAFEQNIELMVEFLDQEVVELVEVINLLRPALREVSLDDFAAFVEVTRDVIEDYQESGRDVPEAIDEELQAAVDIADDILVPQKPEPPVADLPPYEDFLEFVHQLGGSAADEVYARAHGKHNLSGHVKQSYYGTVLFLMGEGGRYVADLTKLPLDSQSLPSEIEDRWNDFLDRHAGLAGEDYDLSILRRILPLTLGGYTTSGGGGSSTFRRVVHLVGRYLVARGLS